MVSSLVSAQPAACARWFWPTQISPYELTVPPPSVLAFSRTIGRSPSSWAASAPARPAMPDPRTTTSQASLEVIGSTSLHPASPGGPSNRDHGWPRGGYLARKFEHD